MKRYIFAIFACVLSTIVSCTQEAVVEKVDGRDLAQTELMEGMQEVILEAYDADAANLTKTLRADDGTSLWSPGDKISLFYGSGTNGGSEFTAINTEPTNRTQFTGQINVITGITEGADDIMFWGVYPFDWNNSCNGTSVTTTIHDFQWAADNSWADGEFPSVGRSQGLAMGFYNICGGIMFYLANDGIEDIVFKGKNNEVIAGPVTVVFNNTGYPEISAFQDTLKEIHLVPLADGTSNSFKKTTPGDTTWYFMILPPKVFSNGHTVTFYKNDGTYAVREFAARTVTRNRFARIKSAPLDNGVTWDIVPPANNQIFYTTTDGNPVTFHPDGGHHTSSDNITNEWDEANQRFVITFPDELTYLDNLAFYDGSDPTPSGALNLETIVLPESLETIGTYAFLEARNLTNVQIGSSLKSVEPFAFMQCESLTSINLPEGLETIGGAAFGLCSSLQSVTLPSSLQSIGVAGVQVINPFYGCRSLASFSGSGSAFSITDDHHFLLTDNGQYLLAVAPGAFGSNIGASCRIPEGIVGIRPYAMVNLIAYSISLPQSLVSIGQGAFIGCDVNLTIDIPSQVTEISFNAFASNDIPRINFGEGDLPAIAENAFGGEGGETYPITMSGYTAVLNGTLLSNIAQWRNYVTAGRVFPLQNNTEIWYHKSDNELIPLSHYDDMNFGSTETPVAATATAFIPSGLPFGVYNAGQTNSSVPMPFSSTENLSIAVVKFNGTVTSIPDNAFKQISTLDFVSLSYATEAIGQYAFSETGLLCFPLSKNNSYNLKTIGASAFYNCSSITDAYLGKVTSIPNAAFQKCVNLKSVTFYNAAAVTDIGGYAFQGCGELEKVGNDEVQSGVVLPNVTTVGEYAFANCSKIVSIDLPEATSLTDGFAYGRQFGACFALQTVNLPKLTSIPEYCFINCGALTTVVLPATVTTVSEGAFKNCRELVQVGTTDNVIDFSNVTSLGSNAFNGCSSIKSVRLGALQTIEAAAFSGCTSLEGVLLSSAENLTTIKAQAFLNCQSLIALRDQDGLTQVRINNVTTIGVQAFENSGIRAFTALNASDIGSSAFKNCTRLQSVNIPAATTLHQSLFSGDTALHSVNAPNATTLQGSVFSGCTALSSLSLPAVQFIGTRAFAMTRSLETLDLGANLQSMGQEIFYDTDAANRNSDKLKIYLRGTDWYNNESNPSSQNNWNIWEAFCYDLETSPKPLFQFKNMYVDADIFDDVCQSYQYSFGTGDYIDMLLL